MIKEENMHGIRAHHAKAHLYSCAIFMKINNTKKTLSSILLHPAHTQTTINLAQHHSKGTTIKYTTADGQGNLSAQAQTR